MTIKEYETRTPKSNEEYFNSLNEEEKKEYINLVEKYNNLLLEFLDKEYNLKEMDDRFLNSPLKYKEVEIEDCDIYQSMAKKKYKFFYIRSNIYIERFSKEELSYLKSITNYDEKVNEFIKSTVIKVATESGESNDHYTISYGSDTPAYFAESNKVVLGFRENRFFVYPNQNSKEWNKNDELKLYETQKNLDELDLRLYKNKGIRFNEIEFNEFSVIPKEQIEELKIL